MLASILLTAIQQHLTPLVNILLLNITSLATTFHELFEALLQEIVLIKCAVAILLPQPAIQQLWPKESVPISPEAHKIAFTLLRQHNGT